LECGKRDSNLRGVGHLGKCKPGGLSYKNIRIKKELGARPATENVKTVYGKAAGGGKGLQGRPVVTGLPIENDPAPSGGKRDQCPERGGLNRSQKKRSTVLTSRSVKKLGPLEDMFGLEKGKEGGGQRDRLTGNALGGGGKSHAGEKGLR